MQKTNGFLILLALVAVILLGFIAGNVAQPPQTAPTYTPWPTYTPFPTFAPQTPQIKVVLVQQPFNYPSNSITQNYPRVDGSTSAKPLQDLIVCQFYELRCRWEWFPGGTPERSIRFLGYSNGDFFVVPNELLPNTKHNGTHDAYINLINGVADFILVARLPSTDELAEAKDKGVVLDAQPIARDAFVMLAYADNSIDTIDIDHIRGIYNGRITNWSQVGGLDLPIHAYQREENSGSQELLKALIMGDTPVIDAPNMIVYTMMGPFNAINGGESVVPPYNRQGDPNGIGYSVYYYTWFIMGPLQNMKILAVEGVRPTSETIADRSYPLTTEVYAVIRAGETPTAPSVLLRDWLLTNEGQYVVKNSGYVPIISLP